MGQAASVPDVEANRSLRKQSILFQHICRRDWDSTIARVRSHPREGTAASACKIEVYGIVRKRVTCLHVACAMKPTNKVIRHLLYTDDGAGASAFLRNSSTKGSFWFANKKDTASVSDKSSVTKKVTFRRSGSMSRNSSQHFSESAEGQDYTELDEDDDDEVINLLPDSIAQSMRHKPGVRQYDSAMQLSFNSGDVNKLSEKMAPGYLHSAKFDYNLEDSDDEDPLSMEDNKTNNRDMPGPLRSPSFATNGDLSNAKRPPNEEQTAAALRRLPSNASSDGPPPISNVPRDNLPKPDPHIPIRRSSSNIETQSQDRTRTYSDGGASPGILRGTSYRSGDGTKSEPQRSPSAPPQRPEPGRMISAKSFRGVKNAFADFESSHWLPLHVACLFRASPKVIETLLKKYPFAAKVMNGMGMLPIHIVCSRLMEPMPPFGFPPEGRAASPVWDPAPVLSLLLRAFPQSVHMPSSNLDASTPLQYVEVNWGPGQKKDELMELLQRKLSSFLPLMESKTQGEQPNVHSFRAAKYDTSPSKRFPFVGRSPKLKSDKPTKLLLYILERDWERAESRLTRAPEEASVWTMIDDEEQRTNGADGCHRLPIHRACALKPPRSLLQALTEAYPECLSCREKYGMLPLHVACHNHAQYSSIDFIMKAYPDGIRTKDSLGLLPLHIACIEGAPVSVITALLQKYPESVTSKDEKGWTPVDYATASFHPNRDAMLVSLQTYGRAEEGSVKSGKSTDGERWVDF